MVEKYIRICGELRNMRDYGRKKLNKYFFFSRFDNIFSQLFYLPIHIRDNFTKWCCLRIIFEKVHQTILRSPQSLPHSQSLLN